jgi:hypothetical protein
MPENNMDTEGNPADRNPHQFLDSILSVATRLIGDPFSETTKARQKCLLISSVIALTLTFSVFDVNELSGLGIKGTLNIHSERLACIFAAATAYLLLLFLVGAIQEIGLMKLRLRYFETQKEHDFDVWMDKTEELTRQRRERSQIGLHFIDEAGKPMPGINDFGARRKLQTQSLEEATSGLKKTAAALEELPEKSEDEDADVQAVRLELVSQLHAHMTALSEFNRRWAELNEEERKADARLKEARAEKWAQYHKARAEQEPDLDKKIRSLEQSIVVGKMGETLRISNLATGHVFFREVIEIALPTLFAVGSIAVCLWRTGCLHIISAVLSKY